MFLNVIRYIHQNPVKGGLVKEINDYKWSSYNEYVSDKGELADKEFVLSIMNKEEFIEFHQDDEKSIFTVNDKVKLTDEEIRRNITKEYKIYPKDIYKLERKERNLLLKNLKKEYSIRELERVTGISRGVIHKS